MLIFCKRDGCLVLHRLSSTKSGSSENPILFAASRFSSEAPLLATKKINSDRTTLFALFLLFHLSQLTPQVRSPAVQASLHLHQSFPTNCDEVEQYAPYNTQLSQELQFSTFSTSKTTNNSNDASSFENQG